MPITHRSILGDVLYCIRRLHNARSHGHGQPITLCTTDHVRVSARFCRAINVDWTRSSTEKLGPPPFVPQQCGFRCGPVEIVSGGRLLLRWKRERISTRGFPPRGARRDSLACRSDRERDFVFREYFFIVERLTSLFFTRSVPIQYIIYIYEYIRVYEDFLASWFGLLVLPFKFNGSWSCSIDDTRFELSFYYPFLRAKYNGNAIVSRVTSWTWRDRQVCNVSRYMYILYCTSQIKIESEINRSEEISRLFIFVAAFLWRENKKNEIWLILGKVRVIGAILNDRDRSSRFIRYAIRREKIITRLINN